MKNLLVIIFLLSAVFMEAQDTLFMNDGRVLSVRIRSSPGLISYELCKDPNQKTHWVVPRKVASIHYAGGKILNVPEFLDQSSPQIYLKGGEDKAISVRLI